MFTVMLVDDEKMVVDALSVTIPWDRLEVKEVLKAYDGPEALAMLENCPVDLIVADIRMPEMSGLELINRVRERHPKIKCIILSGHSDFAYAQEAIKQGVDDYLLKPVSDGDFIGTVQAVLNRLRSERESNDRQVWTQYKLKESQPLLRETLLHHLLQGRWMGKPELSDKLREYDIPLAAGDRMVILLIRTDHPPLEDDAGSAALIQYAIGNIAEETIAPHFPVWQNRDISGNVCVILNCKMTGEASGEDLRGRLSLIAGQLRSSVQTHLKRTVSVAAGHCAQFPDDVFLEYHAVLSALRAQPARGSIVWTRENEPGEAKISSWKSLYEPPTLIHLLDAGRWEAADAKLGEMMKELAAKLTESDEFLQEAYFHLSGAFTYIAHKNGQRLADIIGREISQLRMTVYEHSVRRLSEWAAKVMTLLRNHLSRESKEGRPSMVEQVYKIVADQLSKNVSVQSIADQVYLHPVYLSRIYKAETGNNISDYIFRLRMDKAAYLLKNTDDKVYQIASTLGYQNATYFINVFRKHYGMTPIDYREQ